jgi:RNA polymerase sigma factor (TIGR02999 family)
LLLRWNQGDASAREALVPVVYEELRRIARECLARRRSDQTLQSTALVHEAYLRLVHFPAVQWQDRAHFFALAAQLMRRILVDHARMHRAKKRGGMEVTLALDPALQLQGGRPLDIVELDDALNTLATLDKRQSLIVVLRFFAGLSIEDTSYVLGISPATVKREWATARSWLYQEINREARP